MKFTSQDKVSCSKMGTLLLNPFSDRENILVIKLQNALVPFEEEQAISAEYDFFLTANNVAIGHILFSDVS